VDRDGGGVGLSGRLLVVTAVEAERRALAGLDGMDLVAGGVGPAEAAAATAEALAARDVDAVLSAGIGGGFAACRPGDLAVATRIVFADLGAETPDGFRSASALGFGEDEYQVAPVRAQELAARTGGQLGAVLTVATATGTAGSAAALTRRYPDAVAEGMEGAGVAAAARRRGVAFGEIRAISNPVGPRDRGSWRVDEGLRALRAALAAIAEEQR
jgi:futalosine hydrolase